MMSKTLARLLKRLNEQGKIPASALSNTHRQALTSLFDTDVLVEVRKGRGCSVEVHNPDAFEDFLTTHYPNGLDWIDSEMSRSDATGALRNSKKGRLTSEVVLVSAQPECVLIRQDERLKVGQLTELAQVASFVLKEGPEDHWAFTGRVVLVENYACFIDWQQMPFKADMAIYTAGKISDRMIRWLASSAMKACTFLHWGDYDPVGLDEYLRLKRQLSSRVSLYIPERIEELFARYSNRSLLAKDKTAGLLKRLRTSNDPDVKRILGLMDRNNGGLEQEILIAF
jgi:hypothetical protein